MSKTPQIYPELEASWWEKQVIYSVAVDQDHWEDKSWPSKLRSSWVNDVGQMWNLAYVRWKMLSRWLKVRLCDWDPPLNPMIIPISSHSPTKNLHETLEKKNNTLDA